MRILVEPTFENTAAPAIKTMPAPPLSDDEALSNPVRVTKQMMQYVRFAPNQRYIPVSPDVGGAGVVVLRNSRPGEEEKVIKVVPPPAGDVDPNEPSPPEPFDWVIPGGEAPSSSDVAMHDA